MEEGTGTKPGIIPTFPSVAKQYADVLDCIFNIFFNRLINGILYKNLVNYFG